ncbi:MAG: alpha/beta fold hydrolase [Alphaproteobacteria bacterium]|nr:alpha/beta fold hydrolase [Alphaproteobacteria bacterium]
MRRLVLFLLLPLLAACATPQVQTAHPNASAAPSITGDRLIARDGAQLPLERWLPGSAKAVIVALHGFNDYARAFALPASYWARHGVATYAYDQRGFGRTPPRGVWAGEQLLSSDLADAVVAVRAAHPGVPVYVLGESMGGAVALHALAMGALCNGNLEGERNLPSRQPAASGGAPLRSEAKQGANAQESRQPAASGGTPCEHSRGAGATLQTIDGLILVSPAVWGGDAMNPFFRGSLWLLAHMIPAEKFTGSNLKIQATDNLLLLHEMARDPNIIKGTRVDAVYGIVGLMGHAYGDAAKIGTPPILLLTGGRDEVIPAGPLNDIRFMLGKTSKLTSAHYPEGYHMLLRDLAGRDAWEDILEWMRP